MAGGKREKIPPPGAKGDSSTAFYTRKRWKNLLQLSYLELAGCALNPRGAQIVGNALVKNSSVTKLDLSHNCIGDEGVVLLADALRPNTHINWLNLSHNAITDAGGIALASIFIPNVSASGQPGQWNRNLMTIILMGNRLGDDTLLAFSNAAACHRDLTKVDLSWNGIGPQGTKCMRRCFERNPLCNFDIAANNIGDDGAKYLCEALHRFGGKSQTTLNLYRNDIGHRGAEAVGKLLSSSDMVLDVNLRANTLSSRGAEELRKGLTANPETVVLRSLNLADNMLGDEGAKEIAAIIAADLPFLTRLDVSENQFTDVGAAAIVAALKRSTKLVQVNCQGNNFGGKAVNLLQELIRETKTLKSINLSHCIQSADQRRDLTLAVGDSDGVHVEMGSQQAADGEEDDMVTRMSEFLQIQADQASQKAQEAAASSKKKRAKSAAGAA